MSSPVDSAGAAVPSRKSRRDIKVAELNARKKSACTINPFVISFAFGVLSLLAVFINARFIILFPRPSTPPVASDAEAGVAVLSESELGRVCRASTVVLTDATQSYAREAAILLAEQGFHVLACVKTDAQKRSFFYDMAGLKGLEPIVADVADPPQLADLLYRVRQVQRDLKRPLYAIVVNSVDLPSVAVPLPLPSPLKAAKRRKGRGRGRGDNRGMTSATMAPIHAVPDAPGGSVVDIEALDTAYRRFVKGPVRLLQAATQDDMWGGEGEVNEGDQEEDLEPEGQEGAAGCIPQARIVLLSPTLPGCAAGRNSSDLDVAGLALASRCTAIGMLHSYLQHSRAMLQASLGAVEVIEVYDGGGDIGVKWVVDAACANDGNGTGKLGLGLGLGGNSTCARGGAAEAALDRRFSQFSRKANVLAHSLLSRRPQRIYRL